MCRYLMFLTDNTHTHTGMIIAPQRSYFLPSFLVSSLNFSSFYSTLTLLFIFKLCSHLFTSLIFLSSLQIAFSPLLSSIFPLFLLLPHWLTPLSLSPSLSHQSLVSNFHMSLTVTNFLLLVVFISVLYLQPSLHFCYPPLLHLSFSPPFHFCSQQITIDNVINMNQSSAGQRRTVPLFYEEPSHL